MSDKQEKQERFKRLATTRTNIVIKRIKVLGNCANRSAYDYTEDEINKIFSARAKGSRGVKDSPVSELSTVNCSPPVAEAIKEVLRLHDVRPRGKIAVVVGAGRLVGAPAAKLLRELGAEVSVITQTSGSLVELKTADIVVLGVGEPGFIKTEMLKQDVVLIDAGTSEQGGKLAGDADPACISVASVFTPVPGGIGPIAVAMIFKNLSDLARGA